MNVPHPCSVTAHGSTEVISVRPLTNRIITALDVADVVGHSAGKVGTAECVQSPMVQLGNITDHDSSGEKTNVLKAVLLSTFGTNNFRLGRCIAHVSTIDVGQEADLRIGCL